MLPRRRHLLSVLATIALGAVGCTSSQLVPAGNAPSEALSAVDQDGVTRTLASARGKPLVVYFYPADGTPGCTAEACAFRDAWKRYEQAGVMVFGVSGDDTESKAAFAAEHRIPFPLLADPEHRWAEAFGVGTTLGMMDRVTFLLDGEGRVAKTYPDVDPGVHADQVLADAQALSRP